MAETDTSSRTSPPAPQNPRGRRRLLTLAIVVLLSVGAVACVQWWLDRPLAEIREQIDVGQPDKALKLLNFYLAKHPDQPQALALKARALSAVGESAESIKLFEQVGVADAAEMHAMARAYLREMQWSRAQPLLANVLTAEPRNRDALEDLMTCQMQLGALSEALNTAEKLTHIPGGAARGSAWRAFLHQQAGQTAEALAAFEQALSETPDGTGLPTPAEEFFVQFARAQLACDKLDDAQKSVERSLAIRPNAAAYELFAQIFSRLGQAENALAYWQKAVEVNPADLPAREALAEAALDAKDVNAAQKWLQPLAAAGVIRGRTADLLARTATLMGDQATARRWQGQAEELKRREHIQESVERLLKRAPDSFWAQLVRAHRFAAAGNWTEAQTAIATVALEVPNDPLLQDLVEAIKQQGPLPSLERLPLDRF